MAPLNAEEFDHKPFFPSLKQIRYRGPIRIEARTQPHNGNGPKAIAFLSSSRGTVAERSVEEMSVEEIPAGMRMQQERIPPAA